MVFVLCFTQHNNLQGRLPGAEYYSTARTDHRFLYGHMVCSPLWPLWAVVFSTFRDGFG